MRMTAGLFYAALLSCLVSCGGQNNSKAAEAQEQDAPVAEAVAEEVPQVKDFFFELNSEGLPLKRVLGPAANRSNCFIVISKVHPEHLNVYEVVGADTLLRASYPACIARNKGQKQVRGDNKTPESYPGEPFYISQIQDASDWHHDFGDGRGSLLAYGHWFMRLNTPGFSGIGIHGSTNNRESLKVGRGSEGCIRLLDEDIIHLHDNYAFKGMKVTILPEDHGPLSFERKALALLVAGTAQVVPADKPAVTETAPKEEKVVEKAPKRADKADKKADKAVEEQVVPTWPETVTVVGTRQRLRFGPDPTQPDLYEKDGVAVCPEDGEVLPCLGESGNYYKVRFQGLELYINKVSVK